MVQLGRLWAILRLKWALAEGHGAGAEKVKRVRSNRASEKTSGYECEVPLVLSLSLALSRKQNRLHILKNASLKSSTLPFGPGGLDQVKSQDGVKAKDYRVMKKNCAESLVFLSFTMTDSVWLGIGETHHTTWRFLEPLNQIRHLMIFISSLKFLWCYCFSWVNIAIIMKITTKMVIWKVIYTSRCPPLLALSFIPHKTEWRAW